MGGFTNRVRLPFRVRKPQYPDVTETFRKANGNTVTLSSIVRKVYQLETDYITEQWHEKLAIALAHNNVSVEGEKYFGEVSKSDQYQIAWLDEIANYPTATGKTTVDVTPFDASNSNCFTCDELNQISLVDDAFPYMLNENTTVTLDVINNDSVCCYPVVFSITSFNSDFLDSATISADGIITIHTKTGLVSTNGILLVTYRATCDNGGFDEANVTGNINGSISGCLAPLDVSQEGVGAGGTTTAIFDWVAPSPAPDHYYYQLLSSINVLLQSGTTHALNAGFIGLTPGTAYKFQVRSQCTGPLTDIDDATASNWIQIPFMTDTETSTCGSYQVFGRSTDGKGIKTTYLGCDGAYHTISVPNLGIITVCALQTAPGAFVNITALDIHGSVEVTYIGPCGGLM